MQCWEVKINFYCILHAILKQINQKMSRKVRFEIHRWEITRCQKCTSKIFFFSLSNERLTILIDIGMRASLRNIYFFGIRLKTNNIDYQLTLHLVNIVLTLNSNYCSRSPDLSPMPYHIIFFFHQELSSSFSK